MENGFKCARCGKQQTELLLFVDGEFVCRECLTAEEKETTL